MKKNLLNSLYFNSYSKREWLFIKISLILFWLMLINLTFLNYNTIPFPKGICNIIPFEWIYLGYNKYVIITISLFASILYLFEIKVLYMSFICFVISLIGFTIEESNGVLYRNGLFTFVFFAQFLAYLYHNFNPQSNLSKNRVQFCVQTVAIGYTLSGISKLMNSGFQWVIEGRKMGLQISKSYYYAYLDSGDKTLITKGQNFIINIESHAVLISILLLFALILELFALVSVISKKNAFIYGLLLLAMHIGIYIVMDIIIFPIVLPMIIFMINPLYLISQMFIYLYEKLLKSLNFK